MSDLNLRLNAYKYKLDLLWNRTFCDTDFLFSTLERGELLLKRMQKILLQ